MSKDTGKRRGRRHRGRNRGVQWDTAWEARMHLLETANKDTVVPFKVVDGAPFSSLPPFFPKQFIGGPQMNPDAPYYFWIGTDPPSQRSPMNNTDNSAFQLIFLASSNDPALIGGT
jgi:hypothetical protein